MRTASMIDNPIEASHSDLLQVISPEAGRRGLRRVNSLGKAVMEVAPNSSDVR